MPHGALEELPTALCAEMGLLSPITKIGERVNKHSNLLCTPTASPCSRRPRTATVMPSWPVLPVLPPSSRTQRVRRCGMRRVAMTRRRRRGRAVGR